MSSIVNAISLAHLFATVIIKNNENTVKIVTVIKQCVDYNMDMNIYGHWYRFWEEMLVT